MLDAEFFADLRKQCRLRASLLLAETSLTLQVKAMCRELCGGDQGESQSLYEALRPPRGRDPGQALFDLMASGVSRRAAAKQLGISENTARWWDEKRRSGQYSPPPSHLLLEAAEDICSAFLNARAAIAESRAFTESRLEELASQLPVVGFVQSTRGFGLLSLAQIVGECGDLSQRTPAELWARMGLAVMPDGTRQRRMAGPEGVAHRFSTQRRMIMWNIGDSQIKHSGPYREVYEARKAYEAERDPEITKGHAHNRAKRYMEKRIIRDLWRAWRDTVGSQRVVLCQAQPVAPEITLDGTY